MTCSRSQPLHVPVLSYVAEVRAVGLRPVAGPTNKANACVSKRHSARTHMAYAVPSGTANVMAQDYSEA